MSALITVSPSEVKEQSSLDSQSLDSFRIKVDKKDILFLSSHRNLLECLEDSAVEVHYHCRDGYCGACRVTLKTGQVSYPHGEPLAYVAPNEILPCCCKPTSNLSIDVE